MIPESKLIKNETTIRALSLTAEVKLTKKSMVRWLALSLGLVSPNESRTLILDILEVLFSSHVKKQKLIFPQLFEKVEKLSKTKPTEKAVYYHLLKLKEKGLLKSKGKEYFLSDEDLSLPEVLKGIYSEQLKDSFDKISSVASTFENSL